MTTTDSTAGTRARGSDRPDNRWLSDQRFQAAFENAPIGMALFDADGRLTDANYALCQMLGYEQGELDARTFQNITHPDDVAGSEYLVKELASGEETASELIKRYVDREGSPVLARTSVSVIRDSTGEILQYVAQIEDITARKKAEAAAATNEENFRLAFEAAASGMALVDPRTGRFIEVNSRGCEMLGYSIDELTEMTIADVTAPGVREASMDRFRQVVTGEKSYSQERLHYLKSDGSTAYALVSTALIRDAFGNPLHLVANVVDITEQVQNQDRLEDLVASKDELIASVSHELRTPLTAIVGFAELLRADTSALSVDERVELVQSIADQTSDLTHIVEDLLVAARADNDSLTVAQVPVDVRAQAAQVLETMVDKPKQVELLGDSSRGMGDPARVRQILRNLISNAFRYGGNNISVKVCNRENAVCVEVVDDGEGIPAAERDHVFEPYQRSTNHQPTTASVGLGLTVSRKLARLMGGDLSYRYEAGRSIFELSLRPAF
jgi:PAS domain S-box-containing protein